MMPNDSEPSMIPEQVNNACNSNPALPTTSQPTWSETLLRWSNYAYTTVNWALIVRKTLNSPNLVEAAKIIVPPLARLLGSYSDNRTVKTVTTCIDYAARVSRNPKKELMSIPLEVVLLWGHEKAKPLVIEKDDNSRSNFVYNCLRYLIPTISDYTGEYASDLFSNSASYITSMFKDMSFEQLKNLLLVDYVGSATNDGKDIRYILSEKLVEQGLGNHPMRVRFIRPGEDLNVDGDELLKLFADELQSFVANTEAHYSNDVDTSVSSIAGNNDSDSTINHGHSPCFFTPARTPESASTPEPASTSNSGTITSQLTRLAILLTRESAIFVAQNGSEIANDMKSYRLRLAKGDSMFTAIAAALRTGNTGNYYRVETVRRIINIRKAYYDRLKGIDVAILEPRSLELPECCELDTLQGKIAVSGEVEYLKEMVRPGTFPTQREIESLAYLIDHKIAIRRPGGREKCYGPNKRILVLEQTNDAYTFCGTREVSRVSQENIINSISNRR